MYYDEFLLAVCINLTEFSRKTPGIDTEFLRIIVWFWGVLYYSRMRKTHNFWQSPDIVHGVQMFKLFTFNLHPHDNPEEALYIYNWDLTNIFINN